MSWTSMLNSSAVDPRVIGGRLIESALGYLGIIVVLIVLWVGFKWMTSGGKDEKLIDAHKILINLIIGLIIILSVYGIVNFLIKSINGANGVSQ